MVMCQRLTAILVAMLIALPLWVSAQSPNTSRPNPKTRRVEPKEILDQMLLDVREAKGLAAGIRDARTRTRIEQLLDQIERGAKDLAGRPLARRTPISREDLAKLVSAIKGNAFDNGKISALKLSASQAYFTCEQAKALVGLFAFSDGKRQAALLLYPRLTDPVNFPTVLSVFTFDSDRQAVLKALERK
jgi:hypothetical protein